MKTYFVSFPQDHMGQHNYEFLTAEQLRKNYSKGVIQYMHIRELSPRLEGQALDDLQIGSEYTPRQPSRRVA